MPRSRSRKGGNRSRSRSRRRTKEKTGRSKRSRSPRSRRRDQKKHKSSSGANPALAGPAGPPNEWTGPPTEWTGPPPSGWRPPGAPGGWPPQARPPAAPPGTQSIRPPPDEWHGPGGVPGPRPPYAGGWRPPSDVPAGYANAGYQPPGAQPQGYPSSTMDQHSSNVPAAGGNHVAATPVVPDEPPIEELPPKTPAERLQGITLVSSVLSAAMTEKLKTRGISTETSSPKSICSVPVEAAASLQSRARRFSLSLSRGDKPDFSKPHVPELLPSLNAPGLWKRLRELCTDKGDNGAEVGPPRYELWPSKRGGHIPVPRAPESTTA